MKKFLKKSIAIIAMLAVLFTSVSAFAEGEKKLYEIYELQENFEYENEYMASALRSTVVRIESVVDFRAEYNPVVFSSTDFVDDYLALVQNNPDATVDDIISYMKENIIEYLYYQESTKVVEDSATWIGSGVVISEDGYIATNTHVIEVTEDDVQEVVGSYVAESVVGDFIEIITSAGEWGIEFTEEDTDALGNVIIEASAEYLDVNWEDADLYVTTPPANGSSDYNNAMRYPAEIIKKGTSVDDESNLGITQDGAIIKIDVNNFVALELAEEYPKQATDLLAAGFPVNGDKIFEMAGSQKSAVGVTTSPGSVDRLIDFDKYKAIGITNRISGGNSGGPSVDNTLEIEGLNTYTLSADSRFAYMVPAEFIRDQALGINLVREEVSKTYMLGLQMLQKGYGATAGECFNRVKQLQPDIPCIDELIEDAAKAPQEKAPKMKGSLEISPMVWVIIGVVAGVILLIVLIVVIVSAAGKKKRRNAYYQVEQNSSFGSFDSNSDGSLF